MCEYYFTLKSTSEDFDTDCISQKLASDMHKYCFDRWWKQIIAFDETSRALIQCELWNKIKK